MKIIRTLQLCLFIAVFLLGTVIFTGCANNMTPIDPNSGNNTNPSKQFTDDVKVTYNYSDTDKVQLSNSNVTLKIGQRLILEPAQGLTQNTRFKSSGDTFIGNILKQEEQKDGTRVIFTAIKTGKGKIQVIPNTTDDSRAADLWVTVQ
jgi:hypothetical protein